MGNREAQPLPPDLLELLIEMTERLHAHEHRIEGRGGGGVGELLEQVAFNLRTARLSAANSRGSD